MTTREKLALALNRLRKEHEYSVGELGKLTGRSPKTISAWEVGRGQPDADMLVRLCEIYGLSSVGVFFGEPSALAGDLSEQEYEIVRLFRSLNNRGKDKAIEYMKDISGKYVDNS
jgi:transcriptional regulator with XRE-family HTH domain